MTPQDSLFESLKLCVEASSVCGKHSILHDLGNEVYLKQLLHDVLWDFQTKQLGIPKLIEGVSRRIDRDRIKAAKIVALATEVGEDKVAAFIAAAAVVLMWNFQLLGVTGSPWS